MFDLACTFYDRINTPTYFSNAQEELTPPKQRIIISHNKQKENKVWTPIIIAPKLSKKIKKNLVLDIDGTLVSSSEERMQFYDYVFDVKLSRLIWKGNVIQFICKFDQGQYNSSKKCLYIIIYLYLLQHIRKSF